MTEFSGFGACRWELSEDDAEWVVMDGTFIEEVNLFHRLRQLIQPGRRMGQMK
jgi:hypothetical protein